jgi:membrane protein DedA with SNARE-associated domain
MEDLIRDWGYIILAWYSFGGGFLALAVASVLSYAGELNIYITMVVAGVSNFLGDQTLFMLARYNKAYAKDMMKKYGRKVAYGHVMMRRYGSIAIFIQKYVYGIKTLIPLIIGLTKYDTKRFLVHNFFATIVWTIVVSAVSYSLGEVILNLSGEFKYYGIAIAVVLISALAYGLKKI